MNVLNIDLDFFLNDGIYHRACEDITRPKVYGVKPWKVAEVARFLEETLNLQSPRPGKVVTIHHEVFPIWRDLINSGELIAPFYICHVDAHSDLGMGFNSFMYLHGDFLELPLSQRQYPNEGGYGLNCGSFMAFAVGNRWFSEIDFITPDFWIEDIPQYLLSDKSTSMIGSLKRSEVQVEIELMHVTREKMRQIRSFLDLRQPIGEPKINLNILSRESAKGRFRDKSWDFVFLSHSPSYVPKSADRLIPKIASYIMDLP